MMRNDKDPTLGRMTQVDWDDPDLSRLLDSTETLRLDNRGTHPARAVHLRLGPGGSGQDRRGLLVSDSNAGVRRILFDQPLARGQIISVHRAVAADLRGQWETCSVVDCRGGTRAQDTGRAIYVIDLQAQRLHAPHGD